MGGLSPRDAIPMSKAVVFFGAMASLVVNLIQRNETKESVIDFNVCRVVVPAALAGTFFGVLLNSHSHDNVILAVLCLTLCAVSVMVTRTAWQQYQSETQVPSGAGSASSNAEGSPLIPVGVDSDLTRKEVVLAGALLTFVIACGALRHHHSQCGDSEGYCPLFLAATPMVTSPTAYSLTQGLLSCLPLLVCVFSAANTTADVCSGRKKNDWKMQKAVAFQCMAGATGCLAGLVGIGGGLVFSPFFLVMGMDPAVAVGTSSTCVLFTSTSTTMQYALSGRIGFPLALVYGLVCLCASWQGTSLVLRIRQHFPGRKSYISAIVVFTVLLSVFLVLVKTVGSLRDTVAASQPAAASSAEV